MAGTFIIGERKIRPGAYFNIQMGGSRQAAETYDGTTVVFFRSDFGPLNQAVEITPGEGYGKDYEKLYEKIYGDAGTTDIIQEVLLGGVSKCICIRLGKGGTQASVKLTSGDMEVMSITAKYPGAKKFTVTVREKVSDPNSKECIIYSGVKEFERREFVAGENETQSLVEAFAESAVFVCEVLEEGPGQLDTVDDKPFTDGEEPTVTAEEYSTGFTVAEPYRFNTACVDTEDMAVHILLLGFLNRIFDVGQLALAVVAEKTSVDLETRMEHAAYYNSEKMHYIVNASAEKFGKPAEGYLVAARIAGMIAACPANRSLTHEIISDYTRLTDPMTPTQITSAEKSGCIVLSSNDKGQIWIDSAINTLITPADNQDDGWKKIRRTKTRYELMNRCNSAADGMIGKVDNDSNGRATVVSKLQGIVNAMLNEGKLISGTVTENTVQTADGDYAYFDINVIDKDSIEHIYLTYRFQFSSIIE